MWTLRRNARVTRPEPEGGSHQRLAGIGLPRGSDSDSNQRHRGRSATRARARREPAPIAAPRRPPSWRVTLRRRCRRRPAAKDAQRPPGRPGATRSARARPGEAHANRAPCLAARHVPGIGASQGMGFGEFQRHRRRVMRRSRILVSSPGRSELGPAPAPLRQMVPAAPTFVHFRSCEAVSGQLVAPPTTLVLCFRSHSRPSLELPPSCSARPSIFRCPQCVRPLATAQIPTRTSGKQTKPDFA